jgi:OmpA-OmpF porin, OOP family
MKINQLGFTKQILIAVVLSSGAASVANAAITYTGIRQKLSTYTLDTGHWYAGANIGVSHLHDKKNPGSTNSVNENCPGGSVVGGYQFNSLFGTELGYSQYKNSRETSGGTIIAKTEHYAVHLAATGRYPLINKLSALGKLGMAYNYAQKMAIASGTAKSNGNVSLYWGLGFDYSITPCIDFLAQFAEAVGNKGQNSTGSADLWSIGLNFALV